MNRTWGVFAMGLTVGAAVAALIVMTLTGDRANAERDEEVASLKTQVRKLERELESVREANRASADLQAKAVADLAEPLESPPPEPENAAAVEEETKPIQDPAISGEMTDEQLMARLETFASRMQGLFTGSGKAAREAIQEILKAGGPGTAMRIYALYDKEEDIGKKFGLAHAVAQTGDPEALAKLKAVVLDQAKSFVERRFAAHGFAFSDAEGLEPLYEEVARNDPDLGTRANAAYGLARRTDEGIELYAKMVDQAFEQKDSAAIQYAGGFLLLGKRALPAVHKRIKTIEDKQARLLMIHMMGQHGDPDSIPVLRELAGDPKTDADVRKAAEELAAKIAEGD
jgi:HEAT repeat protein